MLPTPRTDALITTVRELLDGLHRLSHPGVQFDPSKAHRRFSICMTDASHITLLPRLLAHVRAVAPGVVLEAHRIDKQLPQALQSGEADIAIGFLPWLDAGFYQQSLYTQDWVCLANPRHPRINAQAQKRWDLDTYQAEAHIGISSGTGVQLLDNAVVAQHVKREIRLEMPGFLGLMAIVSNSDLIATLPRHIGETLAHTGSLQLLPCPFAIPGFTVKHYWHARYHHDADNRWLRETCADLFMNKSTNS
jgi:DNA-binding transcriptional LysR family regulator